MSNNVMPTAQSKGADRMAKLSARRKEKEGKESRKKANGELAVGCLNR